MENRPIIALDFQNEQAVDQFLSHFPAEEKLFVKVGMELYYGTGPAMVKRLKAAGHSVFLDLKCHDIPNTVKKTMKSLAQLGVDMTNCHCAGGIEMMAAALQGLLEGSKDKKMPILLGVTQLTSTSEEQMHHDQRIEVSLQDSVIHYAKCAQQAGLAGVVCSPLEAAMIHSNVSAAFVCVTPGIRLAANEAGDQKRVTTPQTARHLGSDYIVVGRPITAAADPYQAYLEVKKEWSQAHEL